ncbi:MAG: hypothetical protein M0Z70_07745, partial [Nitrospiraceae bacterium]|nr:hypothetical protein [Nitrospiraceae bacterium]
PVKIFDVEMIKQQPCQNGQSLIFKDFCHPAFTNYPLMHTFMFHLLQNCFISFALKIDKQPVSDILKTKINTGGK